MIEIGIYPDPMGSLTLLGRDLHLLSLNVKSFRVPLERSIQKVLAPSFQLNFQVGGRPGWAPLAASTIERKSRQGLPSDTLIEKGILRKTSGYLNLWKVTTEDASIPGWPGAAAHGIFHDPDGSPAANIPARQILVIQPEDEENIVEVFEDWLDERLNATGFGISRAGRWL